MIYCWKGFHCPFLDVYLHFLWTQIHHIYRIPNSQILWFSVAGNSAGIYIHAVFVTKASGELLKKYAGLTNVKLWITPSFENSAWSIMSISFISLLAMSAVLATCFFVRRRHVRRESPRVSRIREFHGMSRCLVKAMPSLIFTAVLEDNCTSRTCAICLEDYRIGEKLRILPCHHSKSNHIKCEFFFSKFCVFDKIVIVCWFGASLGDSFAVVALVC